MTTTAPAPRTTVDPVRLTAKDIVVNAKQGGALLPSSDSPVSLSVAVHPKPETPVLVRVYPTDRRIVVSLGTSRTDLVLFLEADQIDRFINVLTAGRNRLPAS